MFVPNFKILGQVVPEKSLTKISIYYIGVRDRNQSRTNGPINAHLTIAQVKPRYNHNKEKQEALL